MVVAKGHLPRRHRSDALFSAAVMTSAGRYFFLGAQWIFFIAEVHHRHMHLGTVSRPGKGATKDLL